MITPEVTLWRTVIAQAFIDACATANSAADRIARDEARIWLTGNSPGFRAICECAEVQPHPIRNNAQRQAALGWPGRRKDSDVS